MVNPTNPADGMDVVVPTLEQLQQILGDENVIQVGENLWIAAQKHASVVREVIDYGEIRIKFWMSVLIAIFAFAICIAYYFLNKEIQFYRSKYEDLKMQHDSAVKQGTGKSEASTVSTSRSGDKKE
jgi:hypothetical protein